MRSDASFYQFLAAILDLLTSVLYEYESVFSVDEFSALRSPIIGIKTFFFAFICSKTRFFNFGGHFGFFIYDGFSILSHFTLNQLLDPKHLI